MFEPVRGGTRGGQAEFKWSDVSQDKDRENYLGHSINAPTGRWQKNKDIHWYQRDTGENEAERLAEEIRQLKEAEAEALAAALGFAAGGKPGAPSITAGPASGSNAVAVVNTRMASPSVPRDTEKEERRRRKAERKEEKRAKKEEKKKRRAEREEDEDEGRHRHRQSQRSRSRSPRRHSRDNEPSSQRRLRSRTPPARGTSTYDESEREKERERDRRRWADNARRERPAGGRWGRD